MCHFTVNRFLRWLTIGLTQADPKKQREQAQQFQRTLFNKTKQHNV